MLAIYVILSDIPLYISAFFSYLFEKFRLDF